MPDFEARVLALVERDDYEPLTVKGLARKLQVGEEHYADFRNMLKGLVKTGKLDLARNKTLSKPTGRGRIVGTFRRTSKGFGFVTFEDASNTDQLVGQPNLVLAVEQAIGILHRLHAQIGRASCRERV